MMAFEPGPCAGPSTVVVLLTNNEVLARELSSGLVGRDPGVEIHVVSKPGPAEAHFAVLQPDAVVLDLGAANGDLDKAAKESPSLVGKPLILLGGKIDGESDDRTRFDFVDHVLQDDGYVGAVSNALQKAHETVGLEGRYEEKLQHYSDILEASGDGIFVLIGNRFSYVNQSFATDVGHDSDDLLGKLSLVDLALPEDQNMLREELAYVATTGAERELIEARLTTPEGVVRQFEITCRSSVVEGKRAVVGVAREVTAERQLQEEVDRARQRASQVERLRSLGELAAGVAHDFNNVLEAVLGRAQIAQDKIAKGETPEKDIDLIVAAARDGAITVKRIEEFSRPTGRDSWHDISLPAIVRDATELIKPRVPKSAQLHVSIEETPPARGNGAELREVLLNLLNNAFDAIDPRGRVDVRCYTNGTQAVVEIEDSGHGMSSEVQRRIFEPFFTTKGNEGTGLGLSVSHGILRRHDAQILLESEPGKGTCFRMLFSSAADAIVRSAHTTGDRLAVVVVDDDPTVAELMKDLLVELGHTVTVLNTVNQTLTFLADNEVDLLITDLDLAGMSGWHLARNVRQIQPNIMVGLVTGWPLGATDLELETRGVDFALAKPFSIDLLAKALDRLRGPAEESDTDS